MNLSLIVSRRGFADMKESAAKMVEKQESVVNGALVITHDRNISKADLVEAFGPLIAKFKAHAFIGVSVNHTASEDLQLAVLFGTFIIQAYSRFPGSWLVIDGKAAPVVSNFMSAVERQHNAYNGKMTGRCIHGKGAITPIGPVVLDLAHRDLKFLRYPVATSWRERGRFFFARCRFAEVNADEFLFNLSDSEVVREEKEPAPKVQPPEEKVETIELPENPKDLDSWSREQLSNLIEQQTGAKPHHNLGYLKLVSIAKQTLTSHV